MSRIVYINGGKHKGMIGKEGFTPEGGWKAVVEVHTATRRTLKVKPTYVQTATEAQEALYYRKSGETKQPTQIVTNEQEAVQP